MSDETAESLLPHASIGGAGVCCLGLELIGGTAILGGLTATVGLPTALLYLAIAGIGALAAASLAIGYQQLGGSTGA